MASLIWRTPNQEVVPAGAIWEPFRVMREVLHWDPLREVDATFGNSAAFAPSFDVKETKDAYVFRADLPGVKQEHLEISLTGNRLSVSGHREQDKRAESERYYAAERSYGSFSRSFTLPDGTDGDNVSADLKNGVLVINVPKKPEVQPRKITIGPAEAGKAKA
jgi:HSP20 family protein